MAKFFPLDLSKFKRVSSDAHTTILRHEAGHEVKITHSALSPKLRGNLAALPQHDDRKSPREEAPSGKPTQARFKSVESEVAHAAEYAEGGDVADWTAVAKEGNKIPDPKMDAALDHADAESKARKMEDSQPQMLASGGNPKLEQSHEEPSPTPMPRPTSDEDQNDQDIQDLSRPRLMAEGGGISEEDMSLLQAIKQAVSKSKVSGDASNVGSKTAYKPNSAPVQYQKQMIQDVKGKTAVRRYAEGTGDVTPMDAPQSMDPAALPPTDDAVAVAPAPEAPQPPQVDQSLADKRRLYNQQVQVHTGKGMMAAPGAGFGVNGEAPQNFDPAAWNRAEGAYEVEQKQKAVQQQEAAQQGAMDAKARQQAGLPPVATQGGQGPAASVGQAPDQGAPSQAPQQAPQGAGDPFGTQATMESFQKGLGEAKAGLAGEANALGAQGRQEAEALQQDVAKRQQAQEAYQDHFDKLDAERQNFQQDLINQHIDPNHYLSSIGTVGKISTGIGLILGGMGGGLTHQENPALKFLQSQIDRDINAQMSELGKKENLLSANMKQFGNLRDAVQMTNIMQNDIVSSQLKHAAAKAMDPLAKSRALQAAGKLDMDSAGMQGQMAMRKTLLSAANAGAIPPERIINLLPGLSEGQRGEANKELKDAQMMVKSRDNALSAFDQVAKLNTLGNRLASPIQTSRQVEALVEPLIAQLSKETAGRFTEQDANMLRHLFSKVGSNDETNRVQRAQIVKLMNEKMNFPILKTYGINIGASGRYSDTGENRIQESAPVTRKK